MKQEKNSIAIIGCGVMGAGIARRLASQYTLLLFDRNPNKMEALEKGGFGTPCKDLVEVFGKSAIVILAIKPQQIKDFVKTIDTTALKHTIISILSGTTIAQLKNYFPGQTIIRMMPNLALGVGESATGLATEDVLTKTVLDQVDSICTCLGKGFWIPESKFNGFTSLAGSGIAFVFALIESMVEAGIAMGLPAEESQAIVHQMIKGGLDLVETSAMHPAQLKWQVCSPAGTTIAGLRKFEESGVRAGVINTFLAAYQRAIEQSATT